MTEETKPSVVSKQRTFARRSMLYITAIPQLEKSAGLAVDTLIFDLEDGVALNQELNARHNIFQALTSHHFGNTECLVRLNAVESGLAEDDLTGTVITHPHGYVVSKVESPEDRVDITYWLDEAELLSNWQPESIRLFAMIETALGVMNLREICMATTRLDGLIFGAEDYAASVGAVRTAGNEVLYARSAVVAAAGAYGLHAIDHVCVELQDADYLLEQCNNGKQLGFRAAKQPSTQTRSGHQLYLCALRRDDHAQRLITAYEGYQQSGQGAFAFEGKWSTCQWFSRRRSVAAGGDLGEGKSYPIRSNTSLGARCNVQCRREGDHGPCHSRRR